MKARSNNAWDFKGTPPCDGREWRSMADVVKKMGVCHATVWGYIRRLGWTIHRQNLRRTWVLKEDVDRSLEIIALRQRWYRHHRPPTWREEVCSDFDEETCRRIFWTAAQAALYMGVKVGTIHRWGQQGKIPIFVSGKKGRGRQQWYSPSSLRHLKEDVDYLKGCAIREKAKATLRSGVVEQQVYQLRHKPEVYRKPIPSGWLTVRQVAERLDISRGCVHQLRRRGRLHGKQYYKGRLEDMGDWEEARHRHWFFHEEDVEELKNSEHYLRTREQGKAIVVRMRRQ